MITADIVLVSNRASQTLPGSDVSDTFNQVTTTEAGTVLRRVAATASTTPQEFKISHSLTGGTGFKRRIRSVMRNQYTDLTKDTDLTGGVTPSFAWTLTLDRPVLSDSAITDTILKNALGQLMDMLLQSGNLDKFLNQEG